MNRRDFLRALSAAGITMPLLPGMASADAAPSRNQQARRPRHLVLVELQGGNDGLNTVVPYSDPDYARLRPTLSLKRESLLQLDEGTGLHESLLPLMPLWLRGDLAVVQGVGYPAPNRSHFRSIEIWETASSSDQTLINGWLKPVSDAMTIRQQMPVKALVLANDEGPLAGATTDTVVFNNLNGFVNQARNLRVSKQQSGNAALNHVIAVENTTRSAAQTFARRLDTEQSESGISLPDKAPKLLKQLDLVARMIREDFGPQIYKVQLGSFDTHAGQLSRHAGLLKQLAQSISHFERSLQHSGHWNDVMIMTYSEFGRRIAENGNAGTDHGTAAPHFLMGGRIKGGLHGQSPDLNRLDKQDLQFTTDFRELYSTVSRSWFGQSLANTPFGDFAPLPLVRTA